MSVGERLMIPRISAVAVCCSSASRNSALRSPSSLNKPNVLDGDHGLIGEGFEKSNLLIGKRLDFFATNVDRADSATFSHQGHGQYRSNCGATMCINNPGELFRYLIVHILDVDYLSVYYGPATGIMAIDRSFQRDIGYGP